MRPSLGEEPSEAGEDRRGCGGELVYSQNKRPLQQFRRKLLFTPREGGTGPGHTSPGNRVLGPGEVTPRWEKNKPCAQKTRVWGGLLPEARRPLNIGLT